MSKLERRKSPEVADALLRFGKRKLRDAISRIGYSIRVTDDLTALADRFGSDKGSTSAAHGYTRIYNKLFNSSRKQALTLVEIGVGRSDAPSLRMWREYFENGQIFGFDMDDFSDVTVRGCSVIRGDMSARSDLERLISRIGHPISILIDDGSHVSHHQQIALGALFPALAPGGIYAIEDLHWTNTDLEKSGAKATRDIFREFYSTREVRSPYMSSTERAYLEENIKTLSLYDSLSTAQDDITDALAVLVKKTTGEK